MNPFQTFSHDPNDFERHLEQLSQQSSIIPNPLLAKMKKSSISSFRKGNRRFSTDRNRRGQTMRCRNAKQNPHQILREKACEQQEQHEKMMSHQQHIHDQRPFQNCNVDENYCSIPSSLHAVKTSQSHIGKTPNFASNPGYHLPFRQDVERQSHFSQAEDVPELYSTTMDMHHQLCVRACDHGANNFKLPLEAQAQAVEENSEIPLLDPYEGLLLNVENESQQNYYNRNRLPQHKTPQFSVDIESDFRDAFS